MEIGSRFETTMFVHLFAKYSMDTGDGVVINVTNEGYGYTSQADMKDVFENNPKIASMGKDGVGSDWYPPKMPEAHLPTKIGTSLKSQPFSNNATTSITCKFEK